jgi:hypothetical protein
MINLLSRDALGLPNELKRACIRVVHFNQSMSPARSRAANRVIGSLASSERLLI